MSLLTSLCRAAITRNHFTFIVQNFIHDLVKPHCTVSKIQWLVCEHMWCVRGVTGLDTLTDIVIDIEQVALAGVVLQLLAAAFDQAKPCATTSPAGLGLLWWPRRSVLTATVHSFIMSLYFYNLWINFISLLLQTIFIQHFITIHMCEHLSFVHFANFMLFNTLFIFSILFCLLSISSKPKEGDAWENCLYTTGILYAKVCTRLNHLGAKIEKAPYRGRGANPPPPARSLRSLGLGRFAPSQSHDLFRNFYFEMLGGLYRCMCWYAAISYCIYVRHEEPSPYCGNFGKFFAR